MSWHIGAVCIKVTFQAEMSLLLDFQFVLNFYPVLVMVLDFLHQFQILLRLLINK